MNLETRMQSIRLILSDVDGVLTDGAIVYDSQGVETKRFHVRDGLGIKLWRQAGHHFGILTARSSPMVQQRADELGIHIVHQGARDKWQVARQIMDQLQLSANQVCHIGDDLPDLPVMTRVGLAVAVADAASDVSQAAHWVTSLGGGQGAVRELIETILKQQQIWSDLVAPYCSRHDFGERS